MRRYLRAVCLAIVVAAAQGVSADVWDFDTADEDDSSGTDNELTHGAIQVHDLAAEAAVADQDWYRVSPQSYASYEVLVDGLTGDLFSLPLVVDRIAADGSTVLGSAQNIPNGAVSRSLRWQLGATALTEFIRVGAGGTLCTTTCTSTDQYTIKFFETTGYIARYNNSNSQVTVLLLQNASDYTIAGTIYYFTAAGALAGQSGFSTVAHGLSIVATSFIVPSTSGSIVITHDGRYGDLNGKTVALEPATGFSFDTPMVYKPK